MNSTDAKIRDLLRRSGWPTPERSLGQSLPLGNTPAYRSQKKPLGDNPRKRCAVADVPPYCLVPSNASPEAAATIAAKALGIPVEDSLARWVLLLQFRRTAQRHAK